MPVLSEPYGPVAMIGVPYFLLAFAVLSLCSFVLRRRCTRSVPSPVIPAQTPVFLEKEREIEFGSLQQEQQQIQQQKEIPFPYQGPQTRIQRPPQPPPFTPPTLATGPLVATQDLGFGAGTNASYYDSPMSDSPIISTFDSFEAMGADIPRRRSYTKTTTGGVEVQGEVVMGEGWRRHTRVFGGGVCMACEESERRMTA